MHQNPKFQKISASSIVWPSGTLDLNLRLNQMFNLYFNDQSLGFFSKRNRCNFNILNMFMTLHVQYIATFNTIFCIHNGFYINVHVYIKSHCSGPTCYLRFPEHQTDKVSCTVTFQKYTKDSSKKHECNFLKYNKNFLKCNTPHVQVIIFLNYAL